MRKFLSKSLFFAIFPIVSVYNIFLLEDGTADPFYQRFVSPKQKSLILGNSKAAQGIVPSILDSKLEKLFGTKIYNYSFTVYNSPFGPVYLKSVKNKLSDDINKGYFIITVDAWSISSRKENPNDISLFDENDQYLSLVKNFSSKPNLGYLLNWFAKSYYEIILMRLKDNLSKLHNDGWFESYGDLGQLTDQERMEKMIEFYQNYSKIYAFSEKRLEYLSIIIDYLNSRGTVYLVRMPLENEIKIIEDKVVEDLSLKMKNLAYSKNINFFDFSQSEYGFHFKDGLHLYPESAKQFSLILADLICEKEREKINF